MFPDKISNFLQKKIDQFHKNQVADFVEELEIEAESENRKELKKKMTKRKKFLMNDSINGGFSTMTNAQRIDISSNSFLGGDQSKNYKRKNSNGSKNSKGNKNPSFKLKPKMNVLQKFVNE